MRKGPASSESLTGKVVSIDSARRGEDPQSPPPVSASNSKKRFVMNQHTRRQAIAMFFGMGASVSRASKQAGNPVPDTEEQIRQIGFREWERRAGRAA